MSNPPNWLMWATVIIVAFYVLDIVLKVIIYGVTGIVALRMNKKKPRTY